jgi:hypothetical protein
MADQLNQRLSFQNLNEEQQGSFYSSQAPVLVKFEVGDRVWKWVGSGATLVNKKNKISEYWIPWKSLKIGSMAVPGFKEFRMRHRNLDGSVGRPRDAARSVLAVTHQFNPMAVLLVAEFKEPVWGLVGRAAGQRMFNDLEHPRELSNVYFIGGEYQVVIPGLEPRHIVKL